MHKGLSDLTGSSKYGYWVVAEMNWQVLGKWINKWIGILSPLGLLTSFQYLFCWDLYGLWNLSVSSGGKLDFYHWQLNCKGKMDHLGEVVNPQHADQTAKPALHFSQSWRKIPVFILSKIEKWKNRSLKTFYLEITGYTGSCRDNTEKSCVPFASFPHWLHLR